MRQQFARAAAKHIRQGIIDFVGLTKANNVDSFVHGVSLSLRGFWQASSPGSGGDGIRSIYSPAAYAFCNRRRDRMKLLFFDRPGFVPVPKRLTEGKFRWPRRQQTVVTLTTEQLQWILDGIDIGAMVRHPVRQHQVAG
ncbi:IS66 family insertion sequence element accessory protein TnpB [Mesorhizobium sp. M4B.F.Ca.ET.013.02.1.1]|uniref:IS66 family insertion sequence element accessory protein TnpB n=1 Tax=Mesorhizobium sp. M4B.F.Ca.ET.013.02.1.1 TaxID=2496755 RepID=UPI002479F236|nr:IS66 family insertion sequence element accessory protein TnpB [Mesorhizobium sp. M4B.F.Ca.ET.013.02.1.1]